LEVVMSACPDTTPPPLASPEGELKSVRIVVDARTLEDLLEALSELSFPINPQIFHQSPAPSSRPTTTVEFPAYESRVGDVRRALSRSGFPESALTVIGVMEELARTRRPPNSDS
jgi:hypothetical protein